MKKYGLNKSSIKKLDNILLPYDPNIQPRIKQLFDKAVNDRVKTACDNKDITKHRLEFVCRWNYRLTS